MDANQSNGLNDGQMLDLGTLGGPVSQVFSMFGDSAKVINNAGQVTGWSSTSIGAVHAFLYSNGQMIDVGTLGGNNSWGTNINNKGQVTGYAYTTTDALHGFYIATVR